MDGDIAIWKKGGFKVPIFAAKKKGQSADAARMVKNLRSNH
jgi:hypothetical protein